MAKRRTTYAWTIRYEDPLMAQTVFEDVLRAMQTRQEMYPATFSGGTIDGQELGMLQVNMVVTGRDRWWCDRKAQEFARALSIRAHVTYADVKNPDPGNLPPHRHRGRRRFEAPKYQEARSGT